MFLSKLVELSVAQILSLQNQIIFMHFARGHKKFEEVAMLYSKEVFHEY